ncbi:MAG TPA: undecaprenyl-phosphate alpha-N-acetylglucosaminyl 1-phosphate transferase [Peptococcaceae bacterium]|nr:undecaprenyl-phosphate alpha-N-acetylglucosaminyl 1-phosphate transferase [Peptococcaceae bacterium]
MEGLGIILGAVFIAVLILTPIVKKIALIVGAVDRPDARKVHNKVMPRLGGVAIYLGFIGALLVFQPLGNFEKGLLVGSTIIVAAGILDDIWGLPPKLKLTAQIAAAAVLVSFGIKVEFVTYPFGGIIPLGIFAVPITILWIIGVTNALNLIDGLDGLAAGTSFIAAVTMAVVAWIEGQYAVAGLALILGAAVLGFLPYNFYPAKIFMGDSGSMFLGFTLGSLAVQGLTKGAAFISVFIPIIILGIPIFDTLFAVIRRYRNHRPIFEADREHFHHILLDKGFSHRQAVLLIYGVNVFLGISVILLNVLSTEQSIVALIVLITAISLGAGKLGFFSRINKKQELPSCEAAGLNNSHGQRITAADKNGGRC